MGRNDATRTADRRESRKYMLKAHEFLSSAVAALAEERWNAAGLNAIHAGISAADATVVVSSGQRSASNDHTAAVDLLRTTVSESGASQLRQLAGLLSLKNTVEYEQRLLVESEAKPMVQHAQRLVRWADTVVSSHLGGDA